MKQLDQKIQSILNSIDSIKKAEAPSFFHTRVNANLDRILEQRQSFWMPVKQPVWIIATLIFFLFVNTLLIQYSNINQPKENSSTVKASTLQDFANDYGLNSTNTY